MKKICVWSDDGSDEGFHTGCGQWFLLNDGTPEENKMKFRAFCGNDLQSERLDRPEGDGR